MFVLWSIMDRLYTCLTAWPSFRRFVLNYVGCSDHPLPRDPSGVLFMQLLSFGQLLASLEAVAVFIFNCYTLETPALIKTVSLILGTFHTFHYFVISLRHEFKLKHLFSSWQLVDVITVPG